MTRPIFALNPERVWTLNSALERTEKLGDVKTVKRFRSDIEAGHKAVITLVEYLGQLHTTPVGVMPQTEKHASAWKAAKAAAAVLRATEDKLTAEAKDLGAEVEAEAVAYWKSQLPSQAMQARIYEMAERYVGKGEIENLRSMMADPQVAAVIALSPRELIHPHFAPSVKEGLTNSFLAKFQPEIKAKADQAAELLDLAKGHKDVWRTVIYGVSSEKAAEAHASRPADPVIEGAAA
ncbi:MAG: hypothetical protein GC155_04695 [Alphaproteobacteria bacterium]|nr:hypothetical protein [Alphaproteobacteria bacterium]